MENLENNEIMVLNNNSSLMDLENDRLIALAEIAEKRVKAMKTIITASLSITTEFDWCIIGGKPYLQESGVSKVARSFGVSWAIEKPEISVDAKGYKTYYFKGIFTFQGQSIEAEGSRSMRDDFFARVKDNDKSTKDNIVYKLKTPDEIDERDVRMSAYTNCVNNGIKRLLPGLRNITLDTLKEAGLNLDEISGYTFKTGSKSGTATPKKSTGFVCECCGDSITATVADYSKKKLGQMLCMKCQKEKVNEATKDVPNQTADDLFPAKGEN